jgi:glycine/D-amino acid oxidase-like deaminating enzyme
MAPDAFPIYDQSEDFPGAFSATCHSGVTLAAAHALDLAPAILEGRVPPELSTFTAKRFGAAIADDDWVASRAP